MKNRGLSYQSLVDIGHMVVAVHEQRGCLFAPGTAVRVATDTHREAINAMGIKSDVLMNVLERRFRAEEIYCPHEGIDRRAEFGMATNE